MKTWFWNEVHGEWTEKALPVGWQTYTRIDSQGVFHYNGGLWCYSELMPY